MRNWLHSIFIEVIDQLARPVFWALHYRPKD